MNGDWFSHDDHLPLVDALAARLDKLIAGEDFAERRAAGMATTAEFSQARFEADLKAAWTTILGS